MTPTRAIAASRPMSSRPGFATAGPGRSRSSRSAWSSTSRAAAAPEAGTRMSRGPAASMSGTSNPADRRVIDGMPSSSSRPWTSSASAWWRAPATRTRSPSLYCGLILRARSWAAVTGSSSPVRPAWTSGMPQLRQKRSSEGCDVPQLGQTSASSAIDLDLLDDAVVDAVGAHGRLAVAPQADDQPQHPGPPGGEVDIGLRRIGLRACVRVVDGAELGAICLDVVDRTGDLEPVDLEPQRAGRDVR